MAKAEIKCTCPECGATHYWSVTCHNRREADNWEQYHADDTDRLCPECYAKAKAKERAEAREAENKAAAETAGALGLPALTGSEKQVAWAVSIRQKALDEALAAACGGSTRLLNDDGRALVAAAMATMPTDATWWIDHRNGLLGARFCLQKQIECANWARMSDEQRAAELAKPDGRDWWGWCEEVRLTGWSWWEHHEAEKAEAAAKKAADEAAKRAALPPKPATLAERMGKPGARWNGKFYGRDELRVYLDGAEVQVPADVKAAWNREWAEYNAAKKAAGNA